MPSNPYISRRTALVAGAGATAAVVAGCSGGSKDSGTGSTSAKAGNDDLGPLSAVPVGQAKNVTLPGGKPGILARPTATTAACFSAICTHMGCTVRADGNKLNCPCHGSQYDALTGQVLQGPAVDPLPSVPVTVTDGNVVAKGKA
jgi:Rieske Fe-S protein